MNRLGQETSPYLRQHRDNPVDWWAWEPEAFAEAARRNVPVLLSIGYSACHWCHVMAHESFEDADVAAVMNAGFVCIKVDREERPDVDAIYMEAVQALTGRGGWPLTAFLTPAGEPFHAGTYFPKEQFLQLLAAVSDVWVNRQADIRQNVSAIGRALSSAAALAPGADVPGLDHLNHALRNLIAAFDAEWGGFGGAPKFPSTMNLDLLLRAHHHRPSAEARTVVTTTLDAMASGGMYDHIGGGFARYSVDREWVVPHFEKMLYDQALLVRAYLHGMLELGEDRWRQVIEETIGYVLRELRHPDGGFYCAEDADSPAVEGDPHGHEGLFHTWTPDEVRAVLGPAADAALAWYEMDGPANFAEPGHQPRWIPTRLHHRGEWARPEPIEASREALFQLRARRPRPGLDDKVLTEWNGLMLSSLAEAAAAFDRADWAEAAVANGEFLLRELRTPDGQWHRSWHADGSPPARHAALAADHVALVDGFTRLAELTGEARWLDAAQDVADTLLDHFWDPQQGGLFTTPDDGEALIVRQKDLMDNATPSANGNGAWALARLAAITGEGRYANHADQILRLVVTLIAKAPSAFSQALAAADLRRTGTTEVVIAGERPDLVRAVAARWLPSAVLAWGERTDSPLWQGRADGFAYVCQNYACQLPVDTVEALLAQLDAPS